MDDEDTILGNKIIKKVGLPLVGGYPKKLGSDVLWLKKESLNRTVVATNKEIDDFSEFQKIYYHSQELERLLVKCNFFSEGADWRHPLLGILEEIRRIYPKDVELKLTAEDFAQVDINEEIARLYQYYFGRKPAYSYSELNGYPGPFWNFVRAIREYTGMNITEGAIRKAHQRRKKETN